MDLIKTISWAVVELERRKPNVEDVRRVLDNALQEAAILDLKNKAAQTSVVRMAQVMGL